MTVTADSRAAIEALGAAERQSFGAQFAEVAVDTASGEVRVRRMLGVFDAGRVVNTLTTRGQLVGGMIMGLSMALHEEAVRDGASGAQVNADLAGYHMSSHADVPEIEADWVESVDPDNPAGSRASARSASRARRRPSRTRCGTRRACATTPCRSGWTGCLRAVSR